MKKSYAWAVTISIFFMACYEPVRDDSAAFGDSRPSAAETGNPGANLNSDVETTRDTPENIKMTDSNRTARTGFRENVEKNLTRQAVGLGEVVNESDPVESRIFREYGAVFLTKAQPPTRTMFKSNDEVEEFQRSAGIATESIGGVTIELQPTAMDALRSAIEEASSNGLSISPRDGAEAGRRSFDKTVELWKSRFEPALKHWRSKGRLSDEQISRLRSLSLKEQVAEVLRLEEKGIFFNTFFNNSILFSVAAPGTSQHLSMLAFDAAEYSNPRVQDVMARHGWFRTVQNDAPHFTFIGFAEEELPSLGLKKVRKRDGIFWIPDL